MSIYRGTRTPDGCVVTVNGEPLDPRLDLRNLSLSPTGFEWGCSGPTQLALAILAHHFQDDNQVWGYYQEFKTQVIAGLPDTWQITTAGIEAFIDENIPF